MNKSYLSRRLQLVPACYHPPSINLMVRYLLMSTSTVHDSLQVAVTQFSSRPDHNLKHPGAVRVEILYYEKQVQEGREEQIILYGVEEDSLFQLRPFTLTFATCWYDKSACHHDDRFFDSLIIELSGSAQGLIAADLKTSLYTPSHNIIGTSMAKLAFESVMGPSQGAMTPSIVEDEVEIAAGGN